MLAGSSAGSVAGGEKHLQPVPKHENRCGGLPALGRREWRPALPLLPNQGENVGTGSLQWTTPDLFAGSILDLQPDTGYEVRLDLSDPDGGAATTNLIVRTRPVPAAGKRGRAWHTRPPDWFSAYEQARPGDTILLHAGTYPGSHAPTRQATGEKPIALCAAGDGEVVLDGAGDDVLLDVSGSAHHILENLLCRNAGTFLRAGEGTIGLTVGGCRFHKPAEYGFFTASPTARDFVIADNVFEGPLA